MARSQRQRGVVRLSKVIGTLAVLGALALLWSW
jgi:hypothetical protein